MRSVSLWPILLVAILGTVIVGVGCGGGDGGGPGVQPPGTAGVEGRIVNLDADLPQGVQGIQVTLAGRSDTSDSSGDFLIGGVPQAQYNYTDVVVTATSYELASPMPDQSFQVTASGADLGTIYVVPTGGGPPPTF